MVFCYNISTCFNNSKVARHNPYFSRWFSAITPHLRETIIRFVTILILVDGFLQYSMIGHEDLANIRHNPYFSRWFSAMYLHGHHSFRNKEVTILILVDGFLQLFIGQIDMEVIHTSQSLF